MTTERETLRLEPTVVTCEFLDGNITRHPESHFLDLVVSGRSLRSGPGMGRYLVTQLNRPWLSSVPEAVERLLGRRPSDDLAPGRVALLVCWIDGDLSCGQLTAALDVGDDEVSWSDFQWENGNTAPLSADHLSPLVVFDRSQYMAAFADAYERVAAFPYDELAHRGRRFLWPWQWGWKIRL